MSTIEARSELGARKLWTLRRIGEVTNEARTEGWVRGEPVSLEYLESGERLEYAATPMQLLKQRLGLAECELDVLWLLACLELEPIISKVARALTSPGMHELNLQVLGRLVDLAPDSVARLDGFGLLDVTGDARAPLFRRGLRVNDRVLELARGSLRLDASVTRVAELVGSSEGPVCVPLEVDRALAMGADSILVARGPTGCGRAALLIGAAQACGLEVLRVDAAKLAAEPDIERRVRTLARESLLHEAVLLIDNVDSLTDRRGELERGLECLRRPILMTCARGSGWESRRSVIAFDVEPPDEDVRASLWRQHIPQLSDGVIAFAARYKIGPDLIRQTALTAIARARRLERIDEAQIRNSVCGQLDRRFGRLAKRIETKQSWSDLVLPVDQLELLLELVGRVRYRAHVLDGWGFGHKVGRGLGLTALLSGPPGTGKTMIGGLLANELRLDLYQVDLSQVVSKYIGETEKQLGSVFDAAEAGNAILLFDEADSLFAKRTEVKSSNDRYANLEVNYLLQRIESFEGICLMTTNHEHGIDPAFQRRLAAHVRIPMPDREHRERIWRAMIPSSADVSDGLDFFGLSELRMSGGYIKNAVLRSAYLAAMDQTAITNAHLWKAAKLEYEASGKLIAETH